MSTPPFLDLPPSVRSQRLTTSRGEFAILDAGATSQRTALLVPGWTGSKEDYIAVLEPLASAGYHAVALDLRGQYETPGSGPDGDYSLNAFAADLLAVARSLGKIGARTDSTMPAETGQDEAQRDEGPTGAPPVHVVGHSFGGLVARMAAITDPAAVASLTLLCSGPAALHREVHPLLTAMAEAIDTVGLAGTWQARREYDRSIGAPEVPADIERFLEHRFLTNDPASLRAITLHLTTAPDVIDALAATGVPVQVAFGDADDGWRLADQRDMAQRLGAPVQIIADARHSPAVEQPAATVKALTEFWSTLTSVRS